MERNAAILVLVLLGILLAFHSSRDELVLAIGCWVLAGVYAALTGGRRFL